jgi:hypothetical protein
MTKMQLASLFWGTSVHRKSGSLFLRVYLVGIGVYILFRIRWVSRRGSICKTHMDHDTADCTSGDLNAMLVWAGDARADMRERNFCTVETRRPQDHGHLREGTSSWRINSAVVMLL